MRRLLLPMVAFLAAGPSQAETSKAVPVGIVYWGNSNTGVAVRVVNRVDGDKIAEAEVRKLGGDGWTLLEKSSKPGFGAAMCVRKGSTIVFHTAHGFPSAREAIAAAKEKAKATGGLASFCSRPQWVVNEYKTEAEPYGIIDAVKAGVRQMVICSQPKPAEVKLPPAGSIKPAEAKPACPEGTRKSRDGVKLVCMCVRG